MITLLTPNYTNDGKHDKSALLVLFRIFLPECIFRPVYTK